MEPYINELLKVAVEKESSDLHLVPNSKPVVRINGSLKSLNNFPDFQSEELKKMLIEILDEKRLQALENNLELDFAYSIAGIARFRCNYYFQRGSLSAAFRIVNTIIKSIEELGLPPKVRICKLPKRTGSCLRTYGQRKINNSCYVNRYYQ